MKKLRFLCLFLAVALVVPVLASCSSNKLTATVSIKFVIPATDDAEEQVKFTKENIVVEGTQDNPPTVLQAVQQVFKEYEVTYDLTADGASIAGAFGYTQEEKTDAEKGYYSYWRCLINGNESSDGRQSVTKIYDGDAIEFQWTNGERAREDTAAVTTADPNADTTGEARTNTTAVDDVE